MKCDRCREKTQPRAHGLCPKCYSKDWRERNKAHRAIWARDYRIRRKAEIAATKKRYEARNAEAIREQRRIRYANRKSEYAQLVVPVAIPGWGYRA